jgi:hypothetical protein
MRHIILIFLTILIIGFVLSLLDSLFDALGGVGVLLFMAAIIGILIMAFNDKK